jgi:hypothetical protein
MFNLQLVIFALRFDGIIHVLVLLNLIPVIWEIAIVISRDNLTRKETIFFFFIGCGFTFIYVVEFVLKV